MQLSRIQGSRPVAEQSNMPLNGCKTVAQAFLYVINGIFYRIR